MSNTLESTQSMEKRQKKGAKVYLIFAVVLAFLVLILVPVWFLLDVVGGGHSHGGMMMSVEAFREKLNTQQEAYGLEDGSIRPSSENMVFIMAQQFGFVPPVIRLEQGKHYDLAFYSPDVLHGSTLVDIGGGTLNAVILPHRMTTMSLTPEETGEIRLICNEYCGLGHHLMKGTIIVEQERDPLFPPNR